MHIQTGLSAAKELALDAVPGPTRINQVKGWRKLRLEAIDGAVSRGIAPDVARRAIRRFGEIDITGITIVRNLSSDLDEAVSITNRNLMLNLRTYSGSLLATSLADLASPGTATYGIEHDEGMSKKIPIEELEHLEWAIFNGIVSKEAPRALVARARSLTTASEGAIAPAVEALRAAAPGTPARLQATLSLQKVLECCSLGMFLAGRLCWSDPRHAGVPLQFAQRPSASYDEVTPASIVAGRAISKPSMSGRVSESPTLATRRFF